jgi:hypothetical protein
MPHAPAISFMQQKLTNEGTQKSNWYGKVISLFPANDRHYSSRKEKTVYLFLEEESLSCIWCFNLCPDGASAVFAARQAFCVKGGGEGGELILRWNLSVESSIRRLLSVIRCGKRWILWLLCCKRSSSCEFDGSQMVTQQMCSAQLLYRLRSGACHSVVSLYNAV